MALIMGMIFVRRYDGDDHHLSHATGKILKSHAVTGATRAARHHETRSGTQRMRSTTFVPFDQNVLFDTPCAARHHETRSGTQRMRSTTFPQSHQNFLSDTPCGALHFEMRSIAHHLITIVIK